ncbi:hypothetical protein [Bradyrhizobium niftali]|jgi:hypothetical protein|uniref:Mobilization protein n=1 Tax=Bradyrhizobium niftali TaxID=2560055 RepID=A0A4Y9LYW8_9BRAD|nr:hypothetical protein [Bradyrhizobium niftali]TFV48053.1 hypothetical protein E4K65_14655 [Bradyrhizobium niftali]
MTSVLDNHWPNGISLDAPEPQRAQPRSAVARSEERLAALQAKLAQAKRMLHEASAREDAIRERVVGRAVWALVQKGGLDHAVIDLIRRELRGQLRPAQAGAFTDTVFE